MNTFTVTREWLQMELYELLSAGRLEYAILRAAQDVTIARAFPVASDAD